MKRIGGIAFFFMTVVLLVFVASGADGGPKFQYAVKFVCGKEYGKILAKGRYYTAINVRNATDREIVVIKKFAVALPSEKPGPVTKVFEAKLGPQQVMEIDNADIFSHAKARGFVKGFAVIESDAELDIVAVYTVASLSTGEVVSLHIERITAKTSLLTCPDLVVVDIEKPVWDQNGHQSIIRATIKNIGNAPAPDSLARVIDPSTLQSPGGAPYNAVANTPSLAPGASISVTFTLPYWVFNPDATLEVTADYKNMVTECDENNNTKRYEEKG